tara:strand:- start:3538 stop:4767 length:1230 start_codon:yes stop_codon:yes gene_type:complete
LKVAIIGAGAAGLVTGREFRDAGHEVHILEQGAQPGGVWVYEPRVEDDLLGLNPTAPVYSSIYHNLRTNLPSDLMAFLDYPFDERGGGQSDWPRFPHHSCVLQYLENFARDFELAPLIRYSVKVESVLPEPGGQSWMIEGKGIEPEQFDVVAVCNGHFSKSRVIPIDGADEFLGLKLHSHNYRQPEIFKGQRVAVFGTGASGADIVRELATEAKEVLWCGASVTSDHRRVSCLPLPNQISEQRLHFEQPLADLPVDAIIYCTGYEYDLPFLDETLVQVNDNFVTPLYQQIIPIEWPRLGLIGLPFLVVPFPLYAMQARWFVRTIDGQVVLPDAQTMLAKSLAEQKALIAEGVQQRHLHRLGDRQQGYYNQLASQCGEPALPDSFSELAQQAQRARQDNPGGFRDEPLPG